MIAIVRDEEGIGFLFVKVDDVELAPMRDMLPRNGLVGVAQEISFEDGGMVWSFNDWVEARLWHARS